MKHPQLASRVRSHRKRAGLSQKELGRIVGLDEARISYHERLGIVPPLAIALSYEAIFGVPISELYPRLYHDIRQEIETKLAAMEMELQQSPAKGRQAGATARKLEWFCERNKPTTLV